MSIQDERDLRDQLAGLLDDLEIRPAPVAATVRRGRRIRLRRRVSVAVGVATAVALAAVLPSVLSGLPAQQHDLAHQHDRVTVRALGPTARRNVIAEGATDGEQWNVVGMPPHGASNSSSIEARGAIGRGPFIPVDNMANPTAADPLLMESSGSYDGFITLVGTVTQQVTSVVLRLPDGQRLRLTPVTWQQDRWVAVVLPAGMPIARAALYSGARELAYAVPFRDVFSLWLQPGQAGPARVTRSLGAGVADGRAWHADAYIGPWGWCFFTSSAGDCSAVTPSGVPAGQLVQLEGCSPAVNSQVPITGIVFAAAAVRRVELRFSDGTSATFRPVEVAGVWAFGYAVPANVQVTSSREYGSQGQIIGSQSGYMVGSSAGQPEQGWDC